MKRARGKDVVVVPPAKKFVPKHRACDSDDEEGLVKACTGCGRIQHKCRDCRRILWPANAMGFVFQDKRFLLSLMNACKFKYGWNGNVDLQYVKTTVAEHKRSTHFHSRPHLVRERCGRCEKEHKACSLCGQIFFGSDRTPKYSADALNEFTGFLHVFDQVIDEDLTPGAATCKELAAVFTKMCPSLDDHFSDSV